ncbi:MAG TPA: PAS domain S-box protein, partial [Verrucomicrobiae bacterium]
MAYALAVAASGLTLYWRTHFAAWAGDRPIFAVYFIPILLSAYWGGWGPGCLATAITALGVNFWVLPPSNSFKIERSVDLVQWFILICGGILASILCEALHRARKTAESSRQYYAITLRSIGDAVITTDAAGRVTFLNPVGEAMTGWNTGDAAGKPLPEVFHIINEGTRNPVENPVEKVLKTGLVVGLANHTVLIARDGREAVIDDSAAPILQNDGAIAGVVLVFRDNTAKKRAEDQLRRQEQFLRQTGHIAMVGGWEYDPTTQRIELTDEARNLLDLPSDNGLARELDLGFFAATSRLKMEAALQAAALQGTTFDLELQVITARGVLKWVRTMGQPVQEEGQLTRISGAIQDITDKVKTEQTLRESETRLATIFRASPVGIVITRYVDGRIMDANTAFAAIYGLQREEVIGQTSLDLGLWQQPEDREAMLTEIKAQGRIIDREMRFRNPRTGAPGVLLLSIETIQFAGEKCMLGLARDFTDRKKAEAHLAKLAAIIESSDDAIIGKTLTGIITSWNRGAERIFGYPATEVIGRSLTLLIPPERIDEEPEILAKIAMGEVIEHFETVRVRKDGRLIQVSVTISPLRDEHGRIVGASKIARDITERKRLEEQLRQSQKMEAVGRLSGGIAHDFNNLLTVIRGNASLLVEFDQEPEEQRDCVSQIIQAAERASDLTRQLLLFSRKQPLHFIELELNQCVTEYHRLLMRIVGEDIALSLELAPKLPLIRADGGMVEQVILNLAVNARDAMPNGGKLALQTRLEMASNPEEPLQRAMPCVCLSVTDTGQGIPPEILPRIFEPFFTTKDTGKGTGLGLATV